QGPNTDHWITTAVNRPGRGRQATIRTMDDGCNCVHGKLLSNSSVSPHRPQRYTLDCSARSAPQNRSRRVAIAPSWTPTDQYPDPYEE
ncbi:MAG: hypothetical protein WD403_00920, partial [Pirellulales bacterium]